MFAFADVALRSIFDKRRGAPIYVAKTSAFSFFLVITLLGAAVVSGLATPSEDPPEPILERFMGAIVIAPLVENLILAALAEFFLTLHFKNRDIVIVIALLSAIGHFLVADWRAVSGLVSFATMTYTYLLWHDSRFSRRYFITVMQHVALNTPSFLILSIGQDLI